jgi:glycosyltransferase involved in cell wall biosynthesis
MRIVHLITTTDIGGAERALAQLIQHSDRARFEHLVVSMARIGEIGHVLKAANVPVFSLEMPRGRLSPLALVRMLRLISKLRPSLLHCWMYHANLLGIISAKLARVPRVIWGIRTSGIDFSQYNSLTRYVVCWGARLSHLPDCVVVNSEAGARTHISMGYAAANLVVIPNGFDLEQFHPDCEARRSVREELALGPDAPLIGLIARFDFAKDHETFLKAAGGIIRSHPAVNFLLCGDGVTLSNSALRELADRNYLQARTHFLGPRQDVSRLTAALDIAVSSSRFEGFCNALGEAMSCGVPCVATDVGDSAGIVGLTGKIVPPGDHQALAAACAEFLDIPMGERHTLGMAARERICKNFHLESFVRLHETVYERHDGVSRSPRFRSHRLVLPT